MWVSPNHPNPPRQSAPPEDDGQPLGAFPRGDGGDELWVTLKAFEGRPYVALRVWSRDERGAWWPAKGKGVSVRLGEVSGVIEALRRAAAVAGPQQGGQGDTWPRGVPRTAGAGGSSRGGAPSGPGEGDHDAGKQGPGVVDRRWPDRLDWRAANLPRIGPAEGAAGFDEFGTGADRS